MNSKSSLKKNNSRLDRYIKALREEQIDLFVIDDPIGIYYLTGIKVSRGKLFVHAEKTQFFVDGRYLEMCQKCAPCKVSLLSDETLRKYLLEFKQQVVGFDCNRAKYSEYAQLKKLIQCKPCLNPLDRLRFVKDSSEINKVRKSCSLLNEGYHYIRKKLKVGVIEKDVARDFEIYCRQKGAEKLSFESIIAFGKNSSMPHYQTGKSKLKKDQIVLFDIGIVVNGYHSDMTRTFFFGKGSEKLQKVHAVVKAAQDAVLMLCRPGSKIGALDKAARAVMKKEKLEQYFTHSLGHSIGLETHEYPMIAGLANVKEIVLEPGMIFTVEPGIYLPNVGGVRLEETIMITKMGYQNFYSK